ncbi:hypothetical protein DFH11DRAFT_1543726 [Phellopilus nigrolimitatus]|nr:hypothetical protein DFH11DRAFT_1543726 [Phellopilus nigrolimitatus]
MRRPSRKWTRTTVYQEVTIERRMNETRDAPFEGMVHETQKATLSGGLDHVAHSEAPDGLILGNTARAVRAAHEPVAGAIEGHKAKTSRMIAGSTMSRTVKRLMALFLGTQREQFE